MNEYEVNNLSIDESCYVRWHSYADKKVGGLVNLKDCKEMQSSNTSIYTLMWSMEFELFRRHFVELL